VCVCVCVCERERETHIITGVNHGGSILKRDVRSSPHPPLKPLPLLDRPPCRTQHNCTGRVYLYYVVSYTYCDVLVLLSRPLSRRRAETCCSPQYRLITPLSPTTNDALATVVAIKIHVLFAHAIAYILSILYLSCTVPTHFVFVPNT